MARFDTVPTRSTVGQIVATGYVAQLDRVMPNPVYGLMFCISVLNLFEYTHQSLEPLPVTARAMVKR